jgi:hypothetical protein
MSFENILEYIPHTPDDIKSYGFAGYGIFGVAGLFLRSLRNPPLLALALFICGSVVAGGEYMGHDYKSAGTAFVESLIYAAQAVQGVKKRD